MKTKASNPVPPHMEFPKMVDCPNKCGQPIWLHGEGTAHTGQVCWKCQEEAAAKLAARSW